MVIVKFLNQYLGISIKLRMLVSLFIATLNSGLVPRNSKFLPATEYRYTKPKFIYYCYAHIIFVI